MCMGDGNTTGPRWFRCVTRVPLDAQATPEETDTQRGPNASMAVPSSSHIPAPAMGPRPVCPCVCVAAGGVMGIYPSTEMSCPHTPHHHDPQPHQHAPPHPPTSPLGPAHTHSHVLSHPHLIHTPTSPKPRDAFHTHTSTTTSTQTSLHTHNITHTDTLVHSRTTYTHTEQQIRNTHNPSLQIHTPTPHTSRQPVHNQP